MWSNNVKGRSRIKIFWEEEGKVREGERKQEDELLAALLLAPDQEWMMEFTGECVQKHLSLRILIYDPAGKEMYL